MNQKTGSFPLNLCSLNPELALFHLCTVNKAVTWLTQFSF